MDIPREIQSISQKLADSGYKAYLVGGCTRDILLGKKPNDWDIATDAKPEEIQGVFEDAFYENEFGTVGVKSGSEDPTLKVVEITTFRKEGKYTDKRHPDEVIFSKSIEDDLARRDFTINAIAIDMVDGEDPIDPYGGRDDLKREVIKAVGDPEERFGEDALRLMRAVRLSAQLGFEIEKKTLEAIKAESKSIKDIAAERVRDELFKILASKNPYEGILLFKNSSLLEETLPELEKTFGVEQKSPGRHHIYDVGTHSMLSLKYVAEKNKNPIVRLATLIHDIAKPITFKKLETGTITFYNHEILGAIIAKRIADRLRFSNKEKDKFYRLVRWHQFSVDEHQTDSALRRFIRRVGLENLADILDLRTGDRLGGGARETSWRLEEFKKRLIEVQKQPFTVHDLKIKGNDVMEIMGIPPGPKVGEILQKLFDEVVEKKMDNERSDLLKRLNELK